MKCALGPVFLTHWGRDKLATILETFSCVLESNLNSHSSVDFHIWELVRVMTYRISGTKPLLKPMPSCGNYTLGNVNKFSRYKPFHSRKCIWSTVHNAPDIFSGLSVLIRCAFKSVFIIGSNYCIIRSCQFSRNCAARTRLGLQVCAALSWQPVAVIECSPYQ